MKKYNNDHDDDDRSRNTVWQFPEGKNRIIYNYPPKERWIVVDIYRDVKFSVSIREIRKDQEK